jgi:hypothetical protein
MHQSHRNEVIQIRDETLKKRLELREVLLQLGDKVFIGNPDSLIGSFKECIGGNIVLCYNKDMNCWIGNVCVSTITLNEFLQKYGKVNLASIFKI